MNEWEAFLECETVVELALLKCCHLVESISHLEETFAHLSLSVYVQPVVSTMQCLCYGWIEAEFVSHSPVYCE